MKKKVMTIIEGIAIVVFMLSVSAMDSPNLFIPFISMLISGSVLLLMAKAEEIYG